MSPGRLQGCSRGVFGLTSWEPLRRPGESVTASKAEGAREKASPGAKTAASQAPKPSSAPAKPRAPILAKFNYKKNPGSPLGAELNLKQGEKLVYLEVHADNEHWWLAENNDGEVGYVPAGYMMSQLYAETYPPDIWMGKNHFGQVENRNVSGRIKNEGAKQFSKIIVIVSYALKMGVKPQVLDDGRGLPWLQNREDEIPQEEPVVRKPEEVKTYYCEVCEKKFNGPKPYSAHMTSKAHKEELALRDEEY